jgi:hypothetical protein
MHKQTSSEQGEYRVVSIVTEEDLKATVPFNRWAFLRKYIRWRVLGLGVTLVFLRIILKAVKPWNGNE